MTFEEAIKQTGKTVDEMAAYLYPDKHISCARTLFWRMRKGRQKTFTIFFIERVAELLDIDKAAAMDILKNV